jgi:N-formylglutamate deformylase
MQLLMIQVILHIPHSSSIIPFYDGYVASVPELKQEQLLLTDWYTDDLFTHQDAIPIVADFSRIFCDAERFPEDTDEPMAALGMGVLYETRGDGSPLRMISPELRARIFRDYYNPHHQKLTDAVESQLHQHGKALILDCHSFADKPLRRDLNKNPNRPDLCIGTDGFHTPFELLEKARQFFGERNLSVGINEPYAGSIVPMKYYRKDKRVQTIMLEVNRKLYLQYGTNKKSDEYAGIKALVLDFINLLSTR